MRYLVLFETMLKQEFILMRSYLFNFIAGIIGIYILFLFVFFGARAFGGGEVTLDAIIVGFLVWTFAVSAYNQNSQDLLSEAAVGTLEQLYMSSVGFTWVCLFRIVSSFLITLTFNIAILLLMMVSTGRWLHLDVISLLPLLLLTLAGVYGIGFIMGGLALVFKRIQAFLQIFQFAMIGLVAVPIHQVPVLRFLPLAQGNELIRQVMAEGLSITELPTGDLLFLMINSAFYLGIGLIAFNLLLKTAKNRGLLGHY